MKKVICCTALAIGILFAGTAMAQNASESPVSITTAALVANDKKFEPAVSVPPGGKVVLKSVISNRGSQAAKDLVITNPVPKHMRFDSAGSAPEGAKATYSIDGVTFAAAGALMVKVEKDGAELTRPARPDEYRFVRWSLTKPLAANASAEVSYNAVVE